MWNRHTITVVSKLGAMALVAVALPSLLEAAPPQGIVVTTTAELEAALSPANEGAQILVRAGEYDMSHALTVPDGATLAGEGVMGFDESGLPTGFETSGRTLLRATAALVGDVLTLGDGATVRGLVIEDLADRPGGNPVSGQSNEGHEQSLVGVWLTQVTRRSCDTGEPIGATSLTQLTFAKGGTLLETIGPSIFRSPGNGIWKREHGWNEYSFAQRFMRFDAAGSFVGSGVVRVALTLDETGDHYTSTATNEVLDVNGNVIGTGCATSVSTRFQ